MDRSSAYWLDAIGGDALVQLVEEALEYNRDLAVAAARVRQSAAEARLASAGRWPELVGGLSGSRSKTVIANPLPPEAGLPDLLEAQSTRYDLFGELSWELDLWGRLADTTRAAQAGFGVAEADFAAARLSLIGEVVRRWLEYAEAVQQRQWAEATEASYRQQEDWMTRRYESGLVHAGALRLARSATRAASAEVVARRQQEDGLARALEALLGRYPDRSLPLESEWPEMPRLPLEGIPAEQVSSRPDLRSAEWAYLAAAHEHGATRKLRYPRLTLTASAGTASTELGDLLNSDFGVWSLVGGLTAPIFTAGRISSRIEATLAAEEAALEHFASTLLNAYREVETALAAEKLLEEQAGRVDELVVEARTAEEQIWQEYERGLVEISLLFEARRSAYSSYSQQIAVQTLRRLNRVQLHLALGHEPFHRNDPRKAVAER